MKILKNFLCAVVILAACCRPASAQTNIVTMTNVVVVLVTNVVTVTNVVVSIRVPATPSMPSAPSLVVPPRWVSSISAGLTLTRGNSQTLLFSADFLTEKKTPDDEYSLSAGMAYGTQNSQENVNNYKGTAQWNHLFTERFYGYARASALRDLIADLDYRFTVGPGLGYYLLKSTNNSLAVEGGGGVEFQDLGNKDESFGTLRVAERFEHKFSSRARIWQNVEMLPQVDELDNYVVNFEIGAEASLTKSLSLKTYLDDTYANRPAAGRLKNDAKIVAGVVYKF